MSDDPNVFAGRFQDIQGFSLTHRDNYDALMREL